MSATIEKKESITVDELSPTYGSEGEWFLLDVRTPAEFASGHIPGSVNVPLGDLTKSIEAVKASAGDRKVVVVCRSGNRANTACEELKKVNFPNLMVLQGGMISWGQAGQPVKTIEGAPSGMSLERQVRIVAGTMIFIGSMLGAFLHPGFLAIPAFFGAGLAYAGITDQCGMAMMLAYMPWNRAHKGATTCDVK